jgi:two-component system alkaline phosphatase synthesis response regulator PhoP
MTRMSENATKKVLLADDEERILGLIKATLSGDPRYQVLLASNGADALELARAEHPQLVFLDMMMPKMDGLSTCREIKADPQTREAQVIMLTAMAQDADRRAAADAGADGYMTKPFSPTALLARVEEALGL